MVRVSDPPKCCQLEMDGNDVVVFQSGFHLAEDHAIRFTEDAQLHQGQVQQSRDPDHRERIQ